jgi:hypothetical protein
MRLPFASEITAPSGTAPFVKLNDAISVSVL